MIHQQCKHMLLKRQIKMTHENKMSLLAAVYTICFFHFKKLHIIEGERNGTEIVYSLVDGKVRELVALFFDD